MISHRVVLVALAAAVLTGCPAVYPELGTRTRTMPTGQALDPPPPPELRWIKFVSGKVPAKTRDGRPWQPNGKASAYAKLLANGVEVLRTSSQADTLEPTWPNSAHGNFKVKPSDKLRVELWDANPINDKPISSRELGVVTNLTIIDGKVRAEFEDGIASGGEVVFSFEPAHAVNGLGLWYELRTAGCGITRLLVGSPADRAGLVAGDDVIRIGTKEIAQMSPEDIRSAFNAVPLAGVKLTVRHSTGATAEILLKEGPIYATFEQFGALD